MATETTVLEFIEQELGAEQEYAAWSLAVELHLDELPVRWSPRLRTSAGLCHWIGFAGGRAPVRIDLHPKLREEGPEAIRATFLHELAHAVTLQCNEDDDHGPRWQAACERLGLVNETRYHEYKALRPKRKLVAYCPECEQAWHGTRYLAELGRRTHNRCGQTIATDRRVLQRLERERPELAEE